MSTRTANQWLLEVSDRQGQPSIVPLSGAETIVVGRGKECDIRLRDPEASRSHFTLRPSRGGWFVFDLGSSNGTYVNNRRVRRERIEEGDTISAGNCRLRLLREACASSSFDSLPSTKTYFPVSSNKPDKTKPFTADDPELSEGPPERAALARRFELLRVLHEGSTGRFYLARDQRSERKVCLKCLRDSVAEDASHLQRFVRGIVTASKLRHPNIVKLFAAGKTRGTWWLAMEYVSGHSARQIAQQWGVAGMLSPEKVMAIARDLTAALEVAYEHQVVHRNIRPDSILLTKTGRAKLSNFTLVRGIVLQTLQRITRSGQTVGDVAYLAPEAIEPDSSPDCRSDIYSLGACLYTLLCGKPPFHGASLVELVERIRREDPIPPSRIHRAAPRPLEAVVLRCLAKSPSERFQSPMALREELSRVARFRGI